MRSIQLAILGVACLVLAACDIEEWADSQRFKEDFHKVFDVSPGGSLSIETTNGGVEITGWEKNMVEINGTKYAQTEAVLRDIRVDMSESGDSVTVRVTTPNMFHGGAGARLTIRVPNQFKLDRVVTSNGGIRVESVTGNTRLKTSNGSIKASRLSGSLDGETSNGGIEVQDQTGTTTLRTSNGKISAEGIKGAFEAHTSNGAIEARIMDPAPGVPVKVSTNNGHVDLTLSNLKNNEIRATTSNSSVTVHLPPNVNAQLRAHTSNSSITTDFDVLTHGNLSKHDLNGTLGNGGPLIDIGTSNGSIKILRL